MVRFGYQTHSERNMAPSQQTDIPTQGLLYPFIRDQDVTWAYPQVSSHERVHASHTGRHKEDVTALSTYPTAWPHHGFPEPLSNAGTCANSTSRTNWPPTRRTVEETPC